MESPGGSDGVPMANAAEVHPSSSSSISRDSSSTMGSNRTTEPASLTIRVLQEITDNFSEERALGQGAYGKVYKGVHDNGEEIAVKLLHNNMQAIDDEQFQHEFDNLMMLNHRNIVRLVGYCYETQREHMDFQGRTVFGERTYRALCFEYMHMGSLQRHLSDEFGGLDWQTRYKIIKGTCEGLKYLHEGSKEPIYHLDLKPDNILLDENMAPKLADFGLSKLFGEEQTRVTQSPVGTIGYMPPEYLFGHVVSKKLDVFSLGVVMTKIIAGPSGHTRSAEMPHQEFLEQVHENWRNRFEETCTCSRTVEAYCGQVSICTEIGLSCMESDRHKRPSILDIIDRLDETESMIGKAISLSADARSWVPAVKRQKDYDTNLQVVKVQAFTRSKMIQYAETCDEFPVLVKAMGSPWRRAAEMPRAGVDIVAVLNDSRRRAEKSYVDDMKQAMVVVLEKLGPNDRLSVVSLDKANNRHRVTELTYMSDHGRDVARLKINELGYMEGKYLGAALQEGAKILRGREAEEITSRVGCIMLVLQGSYPEILKQQDISPEFPVHVLGWGYDHGHEEMKHIADITSGTYSFVDSWPIEDVKSALALFITGLTSVTATSVKVTLQAHEDVTISSIESGGYGNLVSSDRRTGTINLDDIYAGEQKNSIVYLKVPQGAKKLMTIGGSYQGLNSKKELLVGMDVVVLRPHRECSRSELVIHPLVAEELLRVGLKNAMSARQHELSSRELERLWDTKKDSPEGLATPSQTLFDLGKDIAQMTQSFYSVNKKYMLSWLSCHEWQRATTKGKASGSTAFQTIGQQHADGVLATPNLVKLEGVTRSDVIVDTETCTEFPVLVRVTVAPWPHADEMPRTGVDVVAVLDISRNMQGETLERMKQAMMIVIDKLGLNDRLSIVSFETHVRRLTELTYMSDEVQGHGRDAARHKISELKASNGRDMGHIAGASLGEGAQILVERGAESSSRLGCMIFLSDGEYPEIFQMQISREFPVHTFGLGDGHNSNVMKYIADETSGTYSFVNQDSSNIRPALALFITGLTSIAATSVQITMRAHTGIAISSIKSGGYIHHVESDRMSGTINIDHIYAGERKEFIVNLTIEGRIRRKLMTIGGRYQSLSGNKSLDEMDLSVQLCRPGKLGELAIRHDVAAELTQSQLQNGILAMLEQKQLTGQGLQNLWDTIKESEEGRGVPDATLSGLSMDVTEMKRDIENLEEHRKSGLPYTLSWLSSHKWQRATTKGASYNSSAFQTIGQLDDGYNNLVKVETFTRSKALPSDNLCNKFPVLVRVTVAPWRSAEKMPRAGVDIVAVLDVSRRMQGAKLKCMKQAMHALIDKLMSADDRLCIVLSNTCKHRLTKLSYMSDVYCKAVASNEIYHLVTGGQNDIGSALREGAQILWWRGEESSRRVGCMVLLSDGKYPEIFQTEISPEFPVHTFGLGTDHNPNVMKYIADMTSGTYSFINQDISQIEDAIVLFITGLTSVAAMSIKIALRTDKGTTISSIESGGYIHHVQPDDRSATIDIDDMYASERKDFIVYLTVEEGKKELMTIGGRYLSHNTVKHLPNTDVCVLRPHQLECLPDEQAIHPDVSAELVRIRLEKGVSAMLEQGPSSVGLQQLWDGIMDSDEGHSASEETLAGLNKDVTAMKIGIGNPKEYRKSGLPYTLSWLTSHKWQRATTKGAPSSSGAFGIIG